MEGVLVSAQRDGSPITITVVTGADGRFSFPAGKLEAGQYALRIRAVGYELAGPQSAEVAPPDPEGKIRRDEKNLIEADSTVIPSRLHPAQAARVQIVFRPTGGISQLGRPRVRSD